MAQHDYVIANGTGAAVRSDLNNALAAIVSQNSGAVAPTTTYAYMPWADTGSSPPVFKIRNAANNDWITLYELDGTFSIEAGSASSPGLYFTGDLNTGIYSPGADQFGISTGGTSRLTIDASGNINMDSGTVYVNAANNRLGIGTTTASTLLHLASSDPVIRLQDTDTNAYGQIAVDNSGNVTIQADESNAQASSSIRFNVDGSERVRLDSSGRLLVGTSSTAGNTDAQTALIQTIGNSGANFQGGRINIGRAEFSANITSGEQLGGIYFSDAQSGTYGVIECVADATGGSNDFPGRLVFSTTADGASSPTERARITSGGYFKASNSGSYLGSTLAYHEFNQDAGNDATLIVRNTNNSLNVGMYYALATRAANTAYSFALFYSSGQTDLEFNLRGDGNAYADGSWNGGGADYAEYFEWSDGNPDEEDRRGISVVLDGDQIRPALTGEDPIGAISGTPSVVGDAAWNKWVGKYLRDDYGTYILDENGDRQLNPAYDPNQEYVPREQRPEWDCVGLMGKLRIRKGQPTGSRWIKMRDISDSVEEWLVR